jgi:hypothetical protein
MAILFFARKKYAFALKAIMSPAGLEPVNDCGGECQQKI